MFKRPTILSVLMIRGTANMLSLTDDKTRVVIMLTKNVAIIGHIHVLTPKLHCQEQSNSK